jgi:hypothetical protein
MQKHQEDIAPKQKQRHREDIANAAAKMNPDTPTPEPGLTWREHSLSMTAPSPKPTATSSPTQTSKSESSSEGPPIPLDQTVSKEEERADDEREDKHVLYEEKVTKENGRMAAEEIVTTEEGVSKNISREGSTEEVTEEEAEEDGDTASKDTALQDTDLPDTTPQDTAVQDPEVQDPEVQVPAVKDTAVQDQEVMSGTMHDKLNMHEFPKSPTMVNTIHEDPTQPDHTYNVYTGDRNQQMAYIDAMTTTIPIHSNLAMSMIENHKQVDGHNDSYRISVSEDTQSQTQSMTQNLKQEFSSRQYTHSGEEINMESIDGLYTKSQTSAHSSVRSTSEILQCSLQDLGTVYNLL